MDVLKSRLIYTAGTFSITPELAACRRLVLLSSVLRLPSTTLYSSEKSNPPKYFLGYAGLFINDYCEKIIPLEFDPQAVLVYDNLAIQLYYAILCTGKLGADNLAGLAALLTPPVVLLPIPFTAAPFPGCVYTTIKFKLLFGTRLQIDAKGDSVISCDGIPVNAAVPNFPGAPSKYPVDRSRSEDPARSLPEEGELPGDTAIATAEDPDLGLNTLGTWTFTWTTGSGGTSGGSFPGSSSDTWALVSPGSVCTLSGSSDLVRNGTDIVLASFNCNNSGFVSVLLSQVFTPA